MPYSKRKVEETQREEAQTPSRMLPQTPMEKPSGDADPKVERK
jgi:hypothetical protein